MQKRRTLVFMLGAALGMGASSVYAETKPLTIVVPYPAGGSIDAMARIVADKLKSTLNRNVLVENKGGAGGRVGMMYLKGLPRDGSAIMLGTGGLIINSILFEDSSGFNFKKDFIGVGQLGAAPMALAVPASSPLNSVQDLVKAATQDRQNFTYGNNGPGSFGHLVGVKFAKAVGLQPTPVAYQGGAPMANDLMGGQIPAAIDSQAEFVERHKARKIKVLGTFASSRSELLPDVATMAEQGVKDVDGELWIGFLAGNGDPRSSLEDFQEGLRRALQDEQVKSKLAKLVNVDYRNAQDFGSRMDREFAVWTPVIESLGLKNQK